MKNKITVVIGIIVLSLIIINMSASHSKLSKTVDSKNSIEMKTIYFAEPGIVTKSITNLGKIDKVNLAYDETSDNNLRYIGKDPNNYVLFNNELWRIIGVMNNIDDGTGNKESRIRITKNGYAYDTVQSFNSNGSINDYSISTLKALLNEEYINKLYEQSKNIMDNVIWNIGGADANLNSTALQFYNYEHGNLVYSGHNSSWKGRIGLIYASDYGFATSAENSSRRTFCLSQKLNDWNNSLTKDCRYNNYLFDDKTWQWTITPSYDNYLRKFVIHPSGDIYYTDSGCNSVRPSLYLKPSTKITGGYGTKSKPYTIDL